MIIQTTKEINGVVYDYAYSGYMIERDGVRRSEAIDPLDSWRLYTEADEPIDVGTKEETVEDYKAVLLGQQSNYDQLIEQKTYSTRVDHPNTHAGA